MMQKHRGMGNNEAKNKNRALPNYKIRSWLIIAFAFENAALVKKKCA